MQKIIGMKKNKTILYFHIFKCVYRKFEADVTEAITPAKEEPEEEKVTESC